jgi:predicted alpha/beta hydrolase
MPRYSQRPQSRPPHYAIETVTLTTASGCSLSVECRHPPSTARGTVILLHSLMTSRRVWNSPRDQGVSATLNDAGLRTLALDFRGHGASRPSASEGAAYGYDDLVREDIPALCEAARQRWPSDRLSIVGHSLGGHSALAAIGTATCEVDALVVLGTDVWRPSAEPHPLLRAKKAALVQTCRLITRARGYFPARSLRFGSDDESAGMMRSWIDWWDRDRWISRDERVDYLAGLSTIKIPVLAIASQGDELYAPPANAARLMRAVAGAQLEVIRHADDGGAAPDHMPMITTRAAASWWHRIAAFCAAGDRTPR